MRIPPLHIALAAALLAVCGIVRVADPQPVARLRLSVFDAYARAAPRSSDPTHPVRIVAIDEASLARVGQWPWPRHKLAELVGKLTAAGARVIAFDLIFAEPDRLSPDALLHALSDPPLTAEAARDLSARPGNDQRFATALSASACVLATVGSTARGLYPPGAARAAFAFAGDDPMPALNAFPAAIGNLPVLTAAAHGIGSANWLPEADQIVRRVPLLVAMSGTMLPSLSLEALRVGSGQSTVFVKSSNASGLGAFGQHTGVEHIRVGETVLPTDGRGEMWLRFAAHDAARTISAADVLDGITPASEIKERFIFIGATAAGLLDLRATPLSAAVPGVEIHAQALEQMLSGTHLTRPAYATGAELTFLGASGALLTWMVGRFGPALAAGFGLASVAAIGLASWLAFTHMGVLLDPVYAALSLVAVYSVTALTRYVRTEVERNRIRSAFGHYLAPSVVDDLARNADRLKLGGEACEATLLFADVRGFTKLTEGLSAEAVVGLVNRLFTPLTDIIIAHRGTVDKFMGDAVMAFWNAPLRDAAHAENACRTALAMQAAVRQLNAQAPAGRAALRIGIGINTGPCVVGNIGSPQRFDYSVLGEPVNIASRFEEATKMTGADIVVGETTVAASGRLAFLELAMLTPRGKDRPEQVYALVGDDTLAAAPAFQSLAAAHRAFHDAIAARDGNAARDHLQRCQQLTQDPLLAHTANIYNQYAGRVLNV